MLLMHDDHTHLESSSEILPRAAASAIQNALCVSPVAVVIGARQTGKTTLMRALPQLAERPYLTLDVFNLRTHAAADPEAVVERDPSLVIDEVQRVPDVITAAKPPVDREPKRKPSRFVLTRSSNPLMMEHIGETHVGSAPYVTLWPFTRRQRFGLGRTGSRSELVPARSVQWREAIDAHAGAHEDWRAAVRLGGFPVPAHDMPNDDARTTWFSGYVQTSLERDLQALRAAESLVDFRRLMRATRLRIGGLLNPTEFGRDVGTGQPPVHQHLRLMKTSFQPIRLTAFAMNRTKRLIKAPKLYWCDTAPALHLAGEANLRGAHLENLVLMDLLARHDTQARRPEVLYWRTAASKALDLVIETSSRTLPIEVSPATPLAPADARGLEALLNEYTDITDGALLL